MTKAESYFLSIIVDILEIHQSKVAQCELWL